MCTSLGSITLHLGPRGIGAHDFDAEVGAGILLGSGKAADLVAIDQEREIASPESERLVCGSAAHATFLLQTVRVLIN